VFANRLVSKQHQNNLPTHLPIPSEPFSSQQTTEEDIYHITGRSI
jgi:hypothetical protein